MYVIIDNINSRIQLFSSCIPFPFLHVFYIIFELYYYNSQSLDSFAFFFLLKTTFSLAKRIYWRDGVSWNNRGNRSSTRFTFPAAFNRGGKKDRRGSKSPEVSRGNKNGNRSLISARPSPSPSSSSPLLRPRFSRIRREDRSFECITNLKPGVSIKQRLADPLRPFGRDVLWGWLLRLISRCRV